MPETVQVPSISNVIDLDALIGKHTKGGLTFSLWSVISANDEFGINIDNVKEGDRITIESASGIASFKETNLDVIHSIVTVVKVAAEAGAAVLSDGESLAYKKQYDDAFGKIKQAIPSKKIKHARRDPWGHDPGTKHYAKHEGGLIVCMPSANGALYARTDDPIADRAKTEGRKPAYFPKHVKEKHSFLPCDCEDGQKSAVATQDGVITILAYDEKFSDNAGWYEIKLTIERQPR